MPSPLGNPAKSLIPLRLSQLKITCSKWTTLKLWRPFRTSFRKRSSPLRVSQPSADQWFLLSILTPASALPSRGSDLLHSFECLRCLEQCVVHRKHLLNSFRIHLQIREFLSFEGYAVEIVSPCSPQWPWTLGHSLASASWVLGPHACVTTLNQIWVFHI